MAELSLLEKVADGRALDCFLSIQFLRCIIDGFERESFSFPKLKETKEGLGEKRWKLIQNFIFLDRAILKPFFFVANAFLLLQGYKEVDAI